MADSASSTQSYKGHDITTTVTISGSQTTIKIKCSGTSINETKSFGPGAQATVGSQASSYINQLKSKIDQAGTSSSGNTGGSTGNTGGSSGPQDGESSGTQVYKGHNIKTIVNITNGLTKITVQCTGPLIQGSKVFGPMANQSTVGNQSVSYINGLKAQIDQAEIDQQQQGDQTGTQPGTGDQTGTQPGTPTQPGDQNYPFPTIVFEEMAMSPNAGATYQITRNNYIAEQIYSQMNGQTYYSGQQAATEYFQKLMGIVNSHGGHLQVNFGNYNGVDFGEITSSNKENYSNTSGQIRQKLWQLFGVGSWDQLALKSQGALGGNTGGTGSTAGTETAGFDTETSTANATYNAIQNQANTLIGWLDNSFSQNIGSWQNRFNDMPELQSQVNERVGLMNSAFQNAAANLKAAGDLEKKAQAIYSNENIAKMNQQLQQKGFDPSKAGPAVFFKAMKDRAQLSAEVYKLQADQEKNLATLETQRAQLVDNIKAAGMEADQWTFQQLNEITKQIEELRNNYDLQKMNIVGQYTLQPMLDVMSKQYEANLQNIADKYQEQFLDANPSQKVVAAARIFDNDWYYVSAGVALNQNNLALPFGKYLALCGDDIRKNKIQHEKDVAAAGASNINVQGGTGGHAYA